MISGVSFRQDFLRVLTGSSIVHLFGTLMAFLVGIQLARGLGVAGYGLYGSAMAAATLGATIASGGVQVHATREIAVYRARGDVAGASRLLGWSICTALVLSTGTALAVGAYVLWGQGASLELAAAAMAVTALMAALTLTAAVARGSGAIVLGQALNVAIRPTVQSALLLLVAALGLGHLEPALALAITGLAILIAMPAGFKSVARIWQSSQPPGPKDIEERRHWRRAAVTMGLTTVIFTAEASVPLILIGALAGLKEAGLYRVAASAMVLSGMAGTMITAMVPAMAAHLFEQGEIERLRRLSAASCLAMTLPTVGVAFILWVFGEQLLSLAFGEEYGAAWAALAILTAGSVAAAFGGIGAALLHAGRREAVVTRAFGFSLAITSAGSLWLAPDAGAEGVAAAVLAGVVIRTAYLVAASQRLIGIDPSLLGTARGWFRTYSREDNA